MTLNFFTVHRPVARAITAATALLATFLLVLAPQASLAFGLSAPQRVEACPAVEAAPAALRPPPAEAAERIPESQLAMGHKDVAWAWLGSPTRRYPHGALGSPVHAGSVHVLANTRTEGWRLLSLALPLHRVYEDRVPRVMDLDGDQKDEIVLIEADALRGAALVVLGVDHSATPARLVERARGPYAGSTFRWMNPAGVADFDGDGRLDLANVVTPHIGGVLQLLHYRPPELVPFARALDVSNHRMGALEQSLSVVVQRAGMRPTLLLPDMTRRALYAFRWDAPGQWTEMHGALPMPGLVERLTPHPNGACATLADGGTWAVRLTD